MSDKEKLISDMQFIVTHLSQQADGHAIQSRIFASMGLAKLEAKYVEHAEEERGYVIQLVDRILDLGGDVKLEAKPAAPMTKDPVEWVKYDLKVSIDGLNLLKKMLDEAKDDYTTFDILKDYYKDEEEDMYWGEQQLELIECIGVQNWILQQI